MYRILLVSLFLITFANTSFSQRIILSGTKVTSREAGFEITFPAGFLVPRRDIQKDKIITFSTESDSGRGTCVVAYNTIQSFIQSDRTVKTILEGTLSNYIRNCSEIISSEDAMLGFFRGKSIIFKEEKDSLLLYKRFDCFVYGNIVLQIAFITEKKSELYKPDILSFFSSLALIDRQFEQKSTKYISEDNDYSIYLPQGYNSNKNGLASDSTAKKNYNPFYIPIRKLEGAVIMASKKYPDDFFKDKNVLQILEEAMLGALDLQKIIPLYGHFIIRDDIYGISFSGGIRNGNSTMFVRYDYYLNEHKLFQVGYSCYTLDELTCDEVKAYFRSFEPIKK